MTDYDRIARRRGDNRCPVCGRDLAEYGGRHGSHRERIPEWRRRALERVERDGNVAVVDLTNS